jgi:formylglycine-generating enzyme required for sulfatase activity
MYRQGALSEDEGGELDERPRNVTLTRPLLVQRRETTQAEWLELMGPHDFSLYPCDECPANRLTWNLALVYANRRSQADGLTPCYFDPEGQAFDDEDPGSHVDVSWPQGPACPGWRLPTEAEWEHFARAGTQTIWWCGNERRCLDAVAWYANTTTDHFEATGLLPPNPWGLHDIHGNLWELTWDEYKDSYGPDATDPTGPSGFTTERVIRGGCFGCTETAVRSANRSSVRRVDDYTNVGMRLVRSLPSLP